MPVYLVGQMRITDPALYKQYMLGFAKVFQHFRGRLLAVDDAPVTLEGQWDADRVAILEFPDRAEAERFYHSSEYRQLCVDFRWPSSEALLLLVSEANLRI